MESAIKQIQNAEEARDTHRKMNFYIKKNSKGAIDHLLVPDGTDENGPFGKKWSGQY